MSIYTDPYCRQVEDVDGQTVAVRVKDRGARVYMRLGGTFDPPAYLTVAQARELRDALDEAIWAAGELSEADGA